MNLVMTNWDFLLATARNRRRVFDVVYSVVDFFTFGAIKVLAEINYCAFEPLEIQFGIMGDSEAYPSAILHRYPHPRLCFGLKPTDP